MEARSGPPATPRRTPVGSPGSGTAMPPRTAPARMPMKMGRTWGVASSRAELPRRASAKARASAVPTQRTVSPKWSPTPGPGENSVPARVMRVTATSWSGPRPRVSTVRPTAAARVTRNERTSTGPGRAGRSWSLSWPISWQSASRASTRPTAWTSIPGASTVSRLTGRTMPPAMTRDTTAPPSAMGGSSVRRRPKAAGRVASMVREASGGAFSANSVSSWRVSAAGSM